MKKNKQKEKSHSESPQGEYIEIPSLEGCRLQRESAFIRHSGLSSSSSPSPHQGEGTLSRHCETWFLRSWQSHESSLLFVELRNYRIVESN